MAAIAGSLGAHAETGEIAPHSNVLHGYHVAGAAGATLTGEITQPTLTGGLGRSTLSQGDPAERSTAGSRAPRGASWRIGASGHGRDRARTVVQTLSGQLRGAARSVRLRQRD